MNATDLRSKIKTGSQVNDLLEEVLEVVLEAKSKARQLDLNGLRVEQADVLLTEFELKILTAIDDLSEEVSELHSQLSTVRRIERGHTSRGGGQ